MTLRRLILTTSLVMAPVLLVGQAQQAQAVSIQRLC